MNKDRGIIALITCALVISPIISACSSRFEPAPVQTLSTKTASSNNLTEITGERYTVQAGDTLFAIAFYSGNTYRELAKINNLSAPYDIQIGQTLRLNATPKKSITNENIDVKQTDLKLSNSSIDHTSTQEYGGNKEQKHRKIQAKNLKTSIKPYNSGWIWPAVGKRKIATVGTDGSNRGLDIHGKLGSEVLAARGGRVVYAGNALKGYGNLVIIKHDDQYLSAYAHNDKILVSEQTYVEQGQKIATMGQSGASEVMLHFEIRKKGKSRDPFLYLLR